jgi:nucleoside-diphosphate-sugar epimerase
MSPGLRVNYQHEVMPGYPDNWQANIDRVTALGWQPQVSLAEGILRTVEWYEHEHS